MNKQFLDSLIKLLDEKKAENIEVVDMQNSDYFVDYVIVATTLNAKHSIAIMSYIEDYIKDNNEAIVHSETSDDWTVVDLGDKLIHLMSEDQRKIYKIEEFLKKYVQQKDQ